MCHAAAIGVAAVDNKAAGVDQDLAQLGVVAAWTVEQQQAGLGGDGDAHFVAHFQPGAADEGLFGEEHLHVLLEPGSAFAWDTGVLVSSVLDIVHNKKVKTAILDVSFTAHMPDTLEMPYRPRVQGASEEPLAGQPQYRLGGVSCLSGDFLEAYSFEKPLKVGQKVVFEDMIHYTMVKTTTFNGVKHPDICIYRKDGIVELVKKFGYLDFKNRLS